GMSLYEHKRSLHPNVHGVPSSVDVEHFAAARAPQADPADQAGIPHPRLGFFGVIDERFDLNLLRDAAAAQPGGHWVMLGPTPKIASPDLPRPPNVHWLGSKSYRELPSYLSGWDVGVMPFARNDATRFISPTKTPEYLAAGLPVVSTSIDDVVDPYERLGLVRIGRAPAVFRVRGPRARAGEPLAGGRVRDEYLARMSWDETWNRMDALIGSALE